MLGWTVVGHRELYLGLVNDSQRGKCGEFYNVGTNRNTDLARSFIDRLVKDARSRRPLQATSSASGDQAIWKAGILGGTAKAHFAANKLRSIAASPTFPPLRPCSTSPLRVPTRDGCPLES